MICCLLGCGSHGCISSRQIQHCLSTSLTICLFQTAYVHVPCQKWVTSTIYCFVVPLWHMSGNNMVTACVGQHNSPCRLFWPGTSSVTTFRSLCTSCCVFTSNVVAGCAVGPKARCWNGTIMCSPCCLTTGICNECLSRAKHVTVLGLDQRGTTPGPEVACVCCVCVCVRVAVCVRVEFTSTVHSPLHCISCITKIKLAHKKSSQVCLANAGKAGPIQPIAGGQAGPIKG